MLTIEEQREVREERMPTAEACNQFDRQTELAADHTDGDADDDVVHFRKPVRNSHHCHRQLNPEGIANLDSHRRQTNRSY